MQDIEKLIKHHDFSRRGNIEPHKTERGEGLSWTE